MKTSQQKNMQAFIVNSQIIYKFFEFVNLSSAKNVNISIPNRNGR